METVGQFAPPSAAEARDRYEALGPTAQVVVREVARAMGLDADEYRERVTSDVVETARDVIFAESLAVRGGSAAEVEDWRAAQDEVLDVEVIGAENVDNVCWHHAPFADAAVAATFHDERDAAVGTLRRQAFGRLYREVV